MYKGTAYVINCDLKKSISKCLWYLLHQHVMIPVRSLWTFLACSRMNYTFTVLYTCHGNNLMCHNLLWNSLQKNSSLFFITCVTVGWNLKLTKNKMVSANLKPVLSCINYLWNLKVDFLRFNFSLFKQELLRIYGDCFLYKVLFSLHAETYRNYN